MTAPIELPDGFRVGHFTDPSGCTGCTVVIPPPGTRGGVDLRGGGTGTRELPGLDPLANAEGPTAVLMTGGSAFGLGAADGVMRWLAERGQGRATGSAVIPHVPAAVIFDLVRPDVTPPGPDAGYAACDAARPGVPERGSIGAGTGAAVGKILGRENATTGGIGFAAHQISTGETIAAVAVANAFGDVLHNDGRVLGGPRDEQGGLLRTADVIAGSAAPPALLHPEAQNTTLVCVCTDANLDKRSCAIVARTASAGIARAVDPAFTQGDGDVLFCLASGAPPLKEPGPESTWALIAIGTVAATVTAEAIRDAVRQSAGPLT